MSVFYAQGTREIKEYAESLGYELIRHHKRTYVFAIPDEGIEVVIRAPVEPAVAKERLRRKAR
jgi:hypothetical protein